MVKSVMMLPLTGWKDGMAATENDNCEDYVAFFLKKLILLFTKGHNQQWKDNLWNGRKYLKSCIW